MWSDRYIGGLPVERWLGDQVFRSRLPDGTKLVVRMLEKFQVRGRSDEARATHFERRVRAWRNLKTPGVTELIEGRFDDPTASYLLISRYVAGTNLGALRERHQRPFGPSEVAELLAPAIRLVRDLHAAGMNHNRLRPSSLVLRRTLKMVDDPFVLVDLDCTDRPPPHARSSAFFHPRQKGDWQSHDVYGLAAIAWYLSRPSHRVPPRPAHRVLAETSALGSEWDRFLQRALHPDPVERPRDLATLAECLDHFHTPQTPSISAL